MKPDCDAESPTLRTNTYLKLVACFTRMSFEFPKNLCSLAAPGCNPHEHEKVDQAIPLLPEATSSMYCTIH